MNIKAAVSRTVRLLKNRIPIPERIYFLFYKQDSKIPSVQGGYLLVISRVITPRIGVINISLFITSRGPPSSFRGFDSVWGFNFLEFLRWNLWDSWVMVCFFRRKELGHWNIIGIHHRKLTWKLMSEKEKHIPNLHFGVPCQFSGVFFARWWFQIFSKFHPHWRK